MYLILMVEKVNVLKEFLIFVIVKDCSVMISFRLIDVVILRLFFYSNLYFELVK